MEIYSTDLSKRIRNGSKIGLQVETGQDMFARMMLYYRGKVKRIEAHWTDVNPLMMDNYNTFTRTLSTTGNESRAAYETFTGKMAKKFGYTRLSGLRKEIEKDGSIHYYATFE
jgi:hypothetical protein